MVAPEISQPAFRQLLLNEKQHLKGKREEMRLKAEKRKQKQKNKGKKRVSNSGAGSSSQEKRHRTDLWRGLEMTEDRDVIYMCQGNKCGIKIPFPWRTWTADERESGRAAGRLASTKGRSGKACTLSAASSCAEFARESILI